MPYPNLPKPNFAWGAPTSEVPPSRVFISRGNSHQGLSQLIEKFWLPTQRVGMLPGRGGPDSDCHRLGHKSSIAFSLGNAQESHHDRLPRKPQAPSRIIQAHHERALLAAPVESAQHNLQCTSAPISAHQRQAQERSASVHLGARGGPGSLFARHGVQARSQIYTTPGPARPQWLGKSEAK